MVSLDHSLISIPRLSCKSSLGGIGLCNVTCGDAQDGAMEMEPDVFHTGSMKIEP